MNEYERAEPFGAQCTNCHQENYDLFVNNKILTRFEDGNPHPKYPEK